MSSLRSRRMARNHRRLAAPPKLNLVALMDIFTILVLFLIVNNGDVEVLQSDKRVALPESVSEQRPQASLIVKVTTTQILVDERPVMDLDDALKAADSSLEPLRATLLTMASNLPPLLEEQLESGRSIVVMGDEKTPYEVLKKVLATCATTQYRDVSLAVNSKPANATEGAIRSDIASAGSAVMGASRE